MRGFIAQGVSDRKTAAKLLIAAKECLQQKEMEAKQEGGSLDEKEAFLKVETLKVLERQERFLKDLDAGKPVEIAPGRGIRKPR